VGRLFPDLREHEQPALPFANPSSPQEAEEAQATQVDAGTEVSPGAEDANGSADTWEDANQGLTWEDYGLPPAKGFVLNEGLDYIPFDIRLPNGDYKPAKYIKVEWGEDPLIYGMIDGDPHQYVESLQASPMPSAGPLRTYTPSQLEFFEEDHALRPEVDEAAHRLYDKGVVAEIECYRRNKVALERDLREIKEIQDDAWKRQMTLAGCARRMAGARVLQRIESLNRSRLRLLMQEYKRRRGRRS
jgi:DNA-binding transcriptional MerR regulator